MKCELIESDEVYAIVDFLFEYNNIVVRKDEAWKVAEKRVIGSTRVDIRLTNEKKQEVTVSPDVLCTLFRGKKGEDVGMGK